MEDHIPAHAPQSLLEMAAESLFKVRKTALGQEIKSGGITKTFDVVAAKFVALNTGVMDALPQSTTSVVASPG